MAEQAINSKDIYKSGSADELQADLKKVLVLQKEVNAANENIKTSSKEALAASNAGASGGAGGNSAVIKANKDLNGLLKEKVELSKKESAIIKSNEQALQSEAKTRKDVAAAATQEAKTITEQTRARDVSSRTMLREKKERERLARLSEKNAKNLTVETNAHRKLTAETNRSQAEFKRLAAQHGLNSRQAKRAFKDFNKLDKELRQINNTARDGRRDVGRYGLALKNAGRTALTVFGGVGIASVVRSTVGVMLEFNKAQADLAAISQRSAAELRVMTKDAKKLGETTQFSATQVTGLQTELSKLGFETDEIINSTSSILNFAAATGADLPSSAKLAGSALRAFGLDASEMERVVSTLGVATSRTALNVEFLETGLSTVAPVAKAFGFSIEDTTALLGQLADSGFDASSSATATRNILLNLADTNGALAKSLKEPVTDSASLAAGLKQLREEGVDLAGALELTDKRSVAAFNTFLDGADKLDEATRAITDQNAVLQEMADDRLKSVSGQYALLTSAVEGYILGTDEANGVSNKIAGTLGFLAKNFKAIASTLITVVKAYVTYKIAVKALKLKDQISNWISVNKSIKDNSKSTKDASKSAKDFGRSLKAIGWTIAIGLAFEMASAMWEVANGTRAARIEEELRRKGLEVSEKVSSKIINDAIKSRDKRLKQLDQEKEKKLAVAKTDAERNIIEQSYAKARKQVIDDETAGVEKLRDQAKQQLKERKIGLQALESLRKKLISGDVSILDSNTQDKVLAALKLTGVAVKEITNETLKSAQAADIISVQWSAASKDMGATFGRVSASIAQGEDAFDRLNKGLDDFKEGQSDANHEVDLGIVVGRAYGTQANKNTKSIKEQSEALNDLSEALNSVGEAQKELLGITEDFEIEDVQARLQDEIEFTEQTGIVRKMHVDFLIEEEERLKRARIERLAAEAIAQENANLLTIENETERAVARIEANDRIEVITTKKNQDLIRLDEEFAGKKKEVLDELEIIQEDYADGTVNQNEKIEKSEKDSNKKRLAELIKFSKFVDEVLTARADKRIALIDKELSAEQAQRDHLAALAEQGIETEVSVATSEAKIAKLEAEKLDEERKKAQIALISSGIDAFAGFINNGEDAGSAVGQTIASVQLLTTALKAIPAFWGGTDWDVQDKLGSPNYSVGRDGYMVRVDGTEGVLTKNKMDKLKGAGYSNLEDVVDNAVDFNDLKGQTTPDVIYKYATLDHDGVNVTKNINIDRLVSQMERVESAIRSSPVENNSFEAISQTMGILSKRVKSNGNYYTKSMVIKNQNNL